MGARERIRARLEKGDSIRYISHLDYIRAIDRAVRRAKIPIAYSEGFHPHARISFGPALAVGIASVAEFADFELLDCLGAGEFLSRMNSALPAGLSILESRSIPADWRPLSVAIVAASYRLLLGAGSIVATERGPGALERAIKEILGARSLIVRRSGERGPERPRRLEPLEHLEGSVEAEGLGGPGRPGGREVGVKEHDVDIRPSLLGLRVARVAGGAAGDSGITPEERDGIAPGGGIALDMLVRIGGGGGAAARPDEILSVIAMYGGIARGMEPASIIRTGLYVSKDGRLFSPMECEGDMSSPQGTYWEE
ncbi:MAG: DUF2344 domain-containing protein [Firmicutes bacterium]|nr:DUF2344 domain-containing protein [Bacillota bacterium]